MNGLRSRFQQSTVKIYFQSKSKLRHKTKIQIISTLALLVTSIPQIGSAQISPHSTLQHFHNSTCRLRSYRACRERSMTRCLTPMPLVAHWMKLKALWNKKTLKWSWWWSSRTLSRHSFTKMKLCSSTLWRRTLPWILIKNIRSKGMSERQTTSCMITFYSQMRKIHSHLFVWIRTTSQHRETLERNS